MSADSTPVCFVIMGFGKKTDHETGRTLDLNATYNAIIKPAAEQAKLRCVRADEASHSGMIDKEMYELLLRADVVVADLSTANPNALYELGVRHALRPYSTVIIKESEGKFYFDLNHIATMQYKHLGEDIGFSEANRASTELATLLSKIANEPKTDSPVYTFLPKLTKPTLSDEEFEEVLRQSEFSEERLINITEEAQNASKSSNHVKAAKFWSQASTIKPNDPYIIQQNALSTYKSKCPSEITALTDALSIISQLDPNNSNDPETLGITGAIHRKIWEYTEDVGALNRAIYFYKRGYEIRKDYYNGENYASCLDVLGNCLEDKDEKKYMHMTAYKVREEIISLLNNTEKSSDFDERIDRVWIFATLANMNFGVGDNDAAKLYEKYFLGLVDADWMKQTYQDNKHRVLENSPYVSSD